MCFLAALPALGALGGAGAGAGGLASIAQLAGAAVSAVGAVAGGVQANNVAKYNAKVAENNARAEQDRAAFDANLIRDRVRRTVGAQKAAGAASGLDIQSGTPVAVLGDTTREGELDILARLYGGDAAASASRNDATRFRAEGRAQQTAGIIGAGSSLLGSFSKMASRRPMSYQPLGA